MSNAETSTARENRPELVLSATLYLLSQCASNDLTPSRASAVIEHLTMISRQTLLPVLLRETAERLIAHWRGVQASLAQEVGRDASGDSGSGNDSERSFADLRELRALLH